MTRPSLRRMIFRGLRRACPWCGGRHAFFTGWFHKHDHCRSCGLRWRRGDVGFELGAASIAAVIVLGPLIVGLGIMTVLTWPEMAVGPMFLVLGLGALILPIVLYPVSYTVWQALDIAMRPVTIDDFVLLEPSDI